MTRLLIARHGNTFNACDQICRVGARTDLPLVESGLEQGRMLGKYLSQENLLPDVVYSSHLKRAKQTAALAIETMGLALPITEDAIFNEIDYGPDEGAPEQDVIARLGQDALDAWDQNAIVPDGWLVDPDTLIQSWRDFAEGIKGSRQTVLVVTSNGIARFAPHLTGDFEGFKSQHKIKLSTGAVSCLTYNDENWDVDFWNVKPKNFASLCDPCQEGAG